MHGAGFSLGGQILGIVGNRVRRKYDLESDLRPDIQPIVLIGRIYALDPAGCRLYEVFYYIYLMKQSARLVMVLHTTHNSKLLRMGMRYVIGHFDFYVYVAEGLDEYCPDRIDETCEHVRAPSLIQGYR